MNVDQAIKWREGVKNEDGTPFKVHNFQVIDSLIAEVKKLREECELMEKNFASGSRSGKETIKRKVLSMLEGWEGGFADEMRKEFHLPPAG